VIAKKERIDKTVPEVEVGMILRTIMVGVMLCMAGQAQETLTPETALIAEVAPAEAHPASPAPVQTMEKLTNSYQGAFVRMLLSLAGVLALLLGTIWFLKRLKSSKWGFGGARQSIHILEKRPLSPKSVLYLVEVGGQRVLLAESQLEVRALCECPAELET
jgi:flagellar biosynthetic protein FliO